MQQENKLGVMPIGRLLAVMSVPMMISFFIQALYNLVDSIFVAMISENALPMFQREGFWEELKM